MIKIILFTIICLSEIFANELNIDNLLEDIKTKSDLSEKTLLENGGVSYIYTRDDISKMQAHNLKDILKTAYPFGYSENSFGVADPYGLPGSIPFMSSSVRVYIDDQEMSVGLYGSGLMLFGDMDIDFVDHIEIYSGNPTFEFSTEPAFSIIKLYSKVAQKDAGSKVSLSDGSYGSKYFYGYNTQELKNGWSYFVYSSLFNNKRKRYNSQGAVLSRDTKTSHLFSSIYKDNHKILIDGIVQKKDTFMDHSVFATPKNNNIKTKYMHIGYNTKYDNISYLITYDQHDTKTDFEDMIKTANPDIPYMIKSDGNSEVYTVGIKYNLNINDNKILAGTNYRHKHFIYNSILINDNELPRYGHTKQEISSIFVEDQYSFANNKILTAGTTYTDVRNNNSIQDDRLESYRLGFTYTKNSLVSKTIFSHIEVTIDPYLVNSIYLANKDEKTAITKQKIFIQHLKYQDNSNKYELIGSHIVVKNQLLPNETGKLYSYKKDLIVKNILTRYTKEYNGYDKFELAMGMNVIDTLPTYGLIKQYKVSARSLLKYNDYDIFNELIYIRGNIDNENYFNYNLGVSHNFTDDLKLSLKGENILNDAQNTTYIRINRNTQQAEKFFASSYDKKIMITLEYTF